MGSHLAGLTSSARESVSGRGAWDNPLMTSFQGASSYNRDISAAAQTGVTFCLPRYRYATYLYEMQVLMPYEQLYLNTSHEAVHYCDVIND